MTIGQFFLNHPQLVGENLQKYLNRVAVLADRPFESVRRTYYRYVKSGWVEVSKTLDNTGKVISSVHKFRQEKFPAYDLPVRRVSTNTSTGQQWVIQESSKEQGKVDLLSFIEDAVSRMDRTPIKYSTTKNFEQKELKNILTDIHAGMSVSDGFLPYTWNSDILQKCFQQNILQVEKEVDIIGGKLETLYLYDLGDSLDGYEGFTTRGGHKLDQNMTTEEQFATVLNNYLSMIEHFLALDIAHNYVVYRVENDNHGGSLGQIVGYSLELIVKRLYPKAPIKFLRQKDFIAYSIYGDNAVVTSHGKDMKHMKRNLPYVMTSTWETYLVSIFKKWKILDKKIRVYKGDLHRLGFSSHNFFEYYNFMAFSPPSAWVQHNFTTGDDIGYSIHILGKQRDDITVINRRFAV